MRRVDLGGLASFQPLNVGKPMLLGSLVAIGEKAWWKHFAEVDIVLER